MRKVIVVAALVVLLAGCTSTNNRVLLRVTIDGQDLTTRRGLLRGAPSRPRTSTTSA